MEVKQFTETLNQYVRPQRSPLAFRRCQSEGDLPEGATMPLRDLGYQVTLCQAIGISSRYGWTLAVGKNDQLCVGGAVVMGALAELPEGLPYPPIPAERRLEFGKYSHVLMAPIEATEYEPEVVAVFGNPAQVCKLVQAAMFAAGEPVLPNIAGPAAGCGAIVAHALNSNAYQFVLHCGGDRIFGAAQDDEVTFAMPWGKAEAAVKGLEMLHMMDSSFRYPTATDIAHRPSLPPMLQVPWAT